MSHDIDQELESIAELTAIARRYMQRGHLDKAAEVMHLVEAIQRRLDRQNTVINMFERKQPNTEREA